MFFFNLKDTNEQKRIDECDETNLNFRYNGAKKNYEGIFSNKILTSEEVKNCSLICPRLCKNIYTKLIVSDTKNKFTGNTNFIIKYKQFLQFVYKAKPSVNLINFFCDLGGIFGLYFGIALMDFNNVFRFFIVKFKQLINIILVLDKFNIINLVKTHIAKLKIWLTNIEDIRWNYIVYIISGPILFSQLYYIIHTYFKYSTETTYEFIPYIQMNNRYSVNEFPAITVCTENQFEDILFGKYYNIEKVEFLNVLYDKLEKNISLNYQENYYNYWIGFYREYLLGLEILWANYTQDRRVLMTLTDYLVYYYTYYNNKQKDKMNYMGVELVKLFAAHNYDHFKAKMNKFENKYLYSLSPTLELLDFYSNHYRCIVQSMRSDVCSQFGQTVNLLSPLGKCHTYLSSTNANQTFATSINLIYDAFTITVNIPRLRRFPHYLDKYIYLHDRNSIALGEPHIVQTHNIGQLDEVFDFAIIVKKVKLKKIIFLIIFSIIQGGP